MKYYNAKQISEMTGLALSTARHKIQILNEELKEKYPNQIIFQGKIPIWFWEEKTEPNKNERKC